MKRLILCLFLISGSVGCTKSQNADSGHSRVIPNSLFLTTSSVEQLETCGIEKPCTYSNDTCTFLDLKTNSGAYCINLANIGELVACETGRYQVLFSYPARVFCVANGGNEQNDIGIYEGYGDGGH